MNEQNTCSLNIKVQNVKLTETDKFLQIFLTCIITSATTSDTLNLEKKKNPTKLNQTACDYLKLV